MDAPAPNPPPARELHPAPGLSLILLTVLGTSAAAALFLALESTGSPLAGTVGEVVRGVLNAVIVGVALYGFLISPLSARNRQLSGELRRLRIDHHDAGQQQAALRAELDSSKRERERETQARQKLEEDLRQSSARLEQTVRERTAPLQVRLQALESERAQLQQTAETLRQSEFRCRSLLEVASGGIWTLDASGRTSFINRHGAETLGCTVHEMIGRPLTDFIFMEDLPQELRAFDLRKGSAPDPFEFRVRHKLGHEPWVRASASCMIGEDGSYHGVLILFEDVTMQRAQAARRVREQRVESATTLAQGLARELGNSISAILLSAEALQPHPNPEDQELVAAIKTSARHGADLLNEVLTFTRGVEGERIVLQPARIVQSAAETLREVFPRNVQISCQTAPDVWDIKGDSTQLRLVLVRLCVNARDAMPGGGVIRLQARNVTLEDAAACARLGIDPGPYVAISVQDSGAPIPQALQERVFEPFFAAREQSTGTGLSLSAAFGVARSHGGTIGLRSAPGEGTTFTLYLPRLFESASPLASASTTLSAGDSATILLVEQPAALRDAMHRALNRAGFRVLAAASGPEALRLLAEKGAELRIMLAGLGTPEVDLPSLARAASEINPGIRVIAATAFGKSLGQSEKLAALQTLGIHRLLPKPCSLEELLAAVHGELRRAGPGNI